MKENTAGTEEQILTYLYHNRLESPQSLYDKSNLSFVELAQSSR